MYTKSKTLFRTTKLIVKQCTIKHYLHKTIPKIVDLWLAYLQNLQFEYLYPDTLPSFRDKEGLSTNNREIL